MSAERRVAAVEGAARMTDLPESVMGFFDRLPLPMQMRVASQVVQSAHDAGAQGNPAGIKVFRHWLETWADQFEADAKGEGGGPRWDTTPTSLS